jgi:hypothetical protein
MAGTRLDLSSLSTLINPRSEFGSNSAILLSRSGLRREHHIALASPLILLDILAGQRQPRPWLHCFEMLGVFLLMQAHNLVGVVFRQRKPASARRRSRRGARRRSAGWHRRQSPCRCSHRSRSGSASGRTRRCRAESVRSSPAKRCGFRTSRSAITLLRFIARSGFNRRARERGITGKDAVKPGKPARTR